MVKTGKIFVYGTLKVGGHFAKKFDDLRLTHTPAKIKGKMFAATGWFPAVVADDSSEVIGELHEYKDFNNLLKMLDRIEGFYGSGNPKNLYNRTTVLVQTEDASIEEEVTVYMFNQPTTGLKEIKSGIWEI